MKMREEEEKTIRDAVGLSLQMMDEIICIGGTDPPWLFPRSFFRHGMLYPRERKMSDWIWLHFPCLYIIEYFFYFLLLSIRGFWLQSLILRTWFEFKKMKNREPWSGVRPFDRRRRCRPLDFTGLSRRSTLVLRLLPSPPTQESQPGMDLGRLRR